MRRGIVPAERCQGAEILEAAQARPEGRSLDQRADAAEVGSRLSKARAEDGSAPRRRRDKPEQHRHRRCLARAVGADEPGDDTGRYLEGKAVDGQSAAEALGEALGPKRRRVPIVA